jgi:hypothetical protein
VFVGAAGRLCRVEGTTGKFLWASERLLRLPYYIECPSLTLVQDTVLLNMCGGLWSFAAQTGAQSAYDGLPGMRMTPGVLASALSYHDNNSSTLMQVCK